MKPFSVLLREGHPFGVVAGVALPYERPAMPIPEEVLARLHPDEHAEAAALKGYRQLWYVGGRLAAASAMRAIGRRPEPVLSGARGEPLCAAGPAVSISHKDRLAVALVARPETGSLGIDLEDLGPPRMSIAPTVLTPAELEEVYALPEERQWTSVLLRFSMKESIYKALAPRLQRYVGFEEANVHPNPSGATTVRLALARGEPPPEIEARFTWLNDYVLTMVRARWT